MHTRSLRTFVAIGRVESFAVAARQLNMTLSAVSMQMKALEERFGIELFDRSVRPPRLTPLGRQLMDHAQEVVAAEDAFVAAASFDDAVAGQFAIGFVNTASVRLLPEFLVLAKTRLPRMRFELSTGLSHVLEEKVQNGTLDAAVVTEPVQQGARLDYLPIVTERILFAAHAEVTTRDPALLAATTPFLQFQPNAGIGKLIARQAAAFTPASAPAPILLDYVDAILECVKRGVGFTMLPEPDIQRGADPRIIAFAAPGLDLTRRLSLVTKDGAGVAARAILGLLLAVGGGEPTDQAVPSWTARPRARARGRRS